MTENSAPLSRSRRKRARKDADASIEMPSGKGGLHVGGQLKERFKKMKSGKRVLKAHVADEGVGEDRASEPVKRKRGVLTDSIKSRSEGAVSCFGFRSMFSMPGTMPGHVFSNDDGIACSRDGVPGVGIGSCDKDVQASACFPSQSAKDACQGIIDTIHKCNEYTFKKDRMSLQQGTVERSNDIVVGSGDLEIMVASALTTYSQTSCTRTCFRIFLGSVQEIVGMP